MKQALSNLVAVLCLLMLVISSAPCSMGKAAHTKMPDNSCAKHQPLNQQTPVCCDAHRQPSATAAAITIEQPTYISVFELSVIHLNVLAILSPPDQLIWPPPLLPLLKLRI